MQKLYSPDNEVELTIILSLLEAECVHHFVHNDHFGTMRIGPRIDLLNKKTIHVAKRDIDKARGILQDYLHSKQTKPPVTRLGYSAWDKLRMVLEVLLFGWFIPGNRWPKKPGCPQESEE